MPSKVVLIVVDGMTPEAFEHVACWVPEEAWIEMRLRSRHAQKVEIPALDISSTDLRARAANGRPLDFLVPEPAVRLIRQRGLYAGGR